MERAIYLAKQAGKYVKGNPQVGAVIVHQGKIIGEGYHKKYGGPHAEINAIRSVKEVNLKYLSDSTIYVTLEPCCIHGKTPPCVDAVLKHGFKRVVIGAIDPNPKVKGGSVKILENAGVDLTTGVMEVEAKLLIRPFGKSLQKLPYVILKWAQSRDGYMGKKEKQVWLSNGIAKSKAHLWRTQIDGILVGHRTVSLDNPQLTARLVPGESPTRIVLTRDASSILDSRLLKEGPEKTILITSNVDHTYPEHVSVIISSIEDGIEPFLRQLYDYGIYRLMIEGGASTLKSFISQSLWDEARIIRTEKLLKSGIRAPRLMGKLLNTESIGTNTIEYIIPN